MCFSGGFRSHLELLVLIDMSDFRLFIKFPTFRTWLFDVMSICICTVLHREAKTASVRNIHFYIKIAGPKKYTQKKSFVIFQTWIKLVKRYPKITFSLFSKLPNNYTKITCSIPTALRSNAICILFVIFEKFVVILKTMKM